MTRKKKAKREWLNGYKRSFTSRLPALFIILLFTAVGSVFGGFFIFKYLFNSYFDSWGTKLVELEKKGHLSKELGAAWQDILAQDEMQKVANNFSEYLPDSLRKDTIVQGVAVKDYPSLSIVSRLNEIRSYSNTIQILDCRELPLAVIKTDHTRARLNEFPQLLIKAIIAAEDQNFFNNKYGYEFESFVRATIRAGWESVSSFHAVSPRGTSTITQQVAKLLISSLDESGNRMVSRSVDRKMRELRLAAALRKMYSPNDILEVYLNHCVASDYGMIGVKDIAKGIFNKELGQLTPAECVYISRMIKWGRNIHAKIAGQCHLDMGRIGKAVGWTPAYQKEVLAQIDTLTFTKPKQIATSSGHLVDLANEFWLLYCKNTNSDTTGYKENMDLINPNSLIRRKGNLTIKLTIDKSLQEFLERKVGERGYGRDTTIYTDVRIGSKGEDIRLLASPKDTLRLLTKITRSLSFSEPGSQFKTTLQAGDTLVTNIRYSHINRKTWHRSTYYYVRKSLKVDGQYYAYCIIDSKTGALLAYYSKDKIGSRLACLLRNRIPNGSSTAKPILNALNFDLGIFQPYDSYNDSLEVQGDFAWKHTITRKNEAPYEAVFANGGIPGKGYVVHNHLYAFEGCKFIFDQLNASNNILGVESVYRLNHNLFDESGNVLPNALSFAQFFYRLNALERIKDDLKLSSVTGVRIYKELANVIGVDIDSMVSYGKRVPIPDNLYSIALGTLELTLWEQAHMFNMLYNNDLIERPMDHPSLAIDRIDINSNTIFRAEQDVVKRYHPFADINNIRPTFLGLHKRLTSNAADGLQEFDVSYIPDSTMIATLDTTRYTPLAYWLTAPVSNYAKSGTTDDVLKPFNADPASNKWTNYGLWNATIRVDMKRLRGVMDSIPEIKDITIACIGECNDHYTGVRDGKTLHKFISRDLLKTAGVKTGRGFFQQYERYIKKVAPDSVKYCGSNRLPDMPKTGEDSGDRYE